MNKIRTLLVIVEGEQEPQETPVNMLDTPLSEWGFASGVDDDVAAIVRSNIQAAQEQTGPYGDRVSSRQGGNRRSRIPASASTRNSDYTIDSQVRPLQTTTPQSVATRGEAVEAFVARCGLRQSQGERAFGIDSQASESLNINEAQGTILEVTDDFLYPLVSPPERCQDCVMLTFCFKLRASQQQTMVANGRHKSRRGRRKADNSFDDMQMQRPHMFPALS